MARTRKRDKRRLKGGENAKVKRRQALLVEAIMSGQKLFTCECGEQLLHHNEHATVWDHQAGKATCERLLLRVDHLQRCQCNHLKYSHRDGYKACVRCSCQQFKSMNRR